MLSSVGDDRERLVFEAQVWNLLTEREQVYCLENGEIHDYQLLTMVKNIGTWLTDKGKLMARPTRLATIRKNSEKYKEIWRQNKQYPTFAAWYYEKILLGYSYSTTLKGVFSKARETLMNVAEIQETLKGSNVEGVFQVIEVNNGMSKAGNKYCKMTVGDESGTIEAMMVGDKLAKFLDKSPYPKEGEIILLAGQNGGEIVWINKCQKQSQRIFLKLGDIKWK